MVDWLLGAGLGASVLGGLFGGKDKNPLSGPQERAERARLGNVQALNEYLKSIMGEGFAERMFREPTDYWTDEHMDAMRRRYNTNVNTDTKTAEEMVRRRMSGQGLTNSGMIGDQYAQLWANANTMKGRYAQDLEFERANQKQQLDNTNFSRALQAYSAAVGMPINYQPEQRNSVFGDLLSGAGQAATVYSLIGNMAQSNPYAKILEYLQNR